MIKNKNLVQVWDVAFNDHPTSDYSVGLTIEVNPEINFGEVIDWIKDRWKLSELAEAIVRYYEKYKPRYVVFKNQDGKAFLMESIQLVAFLHGSDIISHIR